MISAIKSYAYAAVGLLLLVMGVLLWFEHHRVGDLKEQLSTIETANNAYQTWHRQNLKDARDARNTEIADNDAYRRAHPVGPVRLCAPVNLRPVAAPPARASPPAAVADRVHEPDIELRPWRDTPDIGDLLSAFSALFAAKNGDLREQQAVK